MWHFHAHSQKIKTSLILQMMFQCFSLWALILRKQDTFWELGIQDIMIVIFGKQHATSSMHRISVCLGPMFRNGKINQFNNLFSSCHHIYSSYFKWDSSGQMYVYSIHLHLSWSPILLLYTQWRDVNTSRNFFVL